MRVYDGMSTAACARAVRYWNEQGADLVLGPLMHEPTIRVRAAVPTVSSSAVGECQRHVNGSCTVRIHPSYEHHWIVVAHELGHALGYEHDEEHPVMASTLHRLQVP